MSSGNSYEGDRFADRPLMGPGLEEVAARAYAAMVLDNYRATLRARVRALWLTSDTDHDYEDGYEAAKRDVLDLIDGGSDE